MIPCNSEFVLTHSSDRFILFILDYLISQGSGMFWNVLVFQLVPVFGVFSTCQIFYGRLFLKSDIFVGK